VRHAACLCLLLVASGCVIFTHDLRVERDQTATLVLGSVALYEPLERVARHAFLLVRKEGEPSWRSIELGSGAHVVPDGEAERVAHEAGDVAVHGVWRGPRAAAFIECIEREAVELTPRAHRDYRFWPGPNSNTYVDTLLRRCRIPGTLPATCVGRDWRGAIGASVTSGRTGVQLETPVFGIKIGLREGIEIHIGTLAFGIAFWPPAIIVPFATGRIGFDER
jgi:hypothetical protein